MIKVVDIKIVDRLRKKPTSIESLTASIDRHGLLHPISVTPDNILIGGYRRIKAFECLCKTEIPCIVADPTINRTQAEYDENVERADFALEDIAEIYKLVPASRVGHRPKKTEEREDNDNDENVGNLPTFPKGPSDIVTGKIVGHSEQDVNKIKLVDAARGNPELQYLVDQVDSRDKKLNVTIKEYLHLKIPNPRSRNVLYIFGVVMSTFWPPGLRDTVVCASLEAHRLFYTLGHQSKTADI